MLCSFAHKTNKRTAQLLLITKENFDSKAEWESVYDYLGFQTPTEEKQNKSKMQKGDDPIVFSQNNARIIHY